MIRRWQPVARSTIAILLLLSLSVVFVHWHQDKTGRDCGLCYAHQMPGLQNAAEPLPAVPRVTEWRLVVPEAVLESSAFVLSHSGRAPPLSLS
jgi:hypothetical protein